MSLNKDKPDPAKATALYQTALPLFTEKTTQIAKNLPRSHAG